MSSKLMATIAAAVPLLIGVSYRLGNDRKLSVSVSWKHFSNANLYSDNDGIDLPVVLNVGVRF